MPYFGCHLSPSGGYAAMVRTAVSLRADTVQFFTRNPRGSRAKAPDLEDAAQAGSLMGERDFGPIVAHGAYTMNLCTRDPEALAFAAQVLREDLGRTTLLPGCLYNFHPGSHVGQGLQEGVRQIAAALEGALSAEPTACVLLETMAGKGTEIGGRFQELRMILDAVQSPQLHVCLDTCHVWDGGYDIAGSLDGVLEEFDPVLGLSHLRAIHLNDSKNPLGAHKDRHACLGEGCIGLEALLRVATHPALKHLPMILETPNDLPGYAREIGILRQA